jgi:hypothetical protein
MDTDEKRVAEIASSFFHTCQEQGLQLPFMVFTVAISGSFSVSRLDEAQNEWLAVHEVGEGFVVPINLVVSDAMDRLASGKISREGVLTPTA